jgi:hypothetical protein
MYSINNSIISLIIFNKTLNSTTITLDINPSIEITLNKNK